MVLKMRSISTGCAFLINLRMDWGRSRTINKPILEILSLIHI